MFVTPVEMARSVADRIRSLRLESGWSQDEMARRAGIAPETYKRFERTGQVSLERLARAAIALGRAEDLASMFEPAEVESLDDLVEDAPRRKRGRSM